MPMHLLQVADRRLGPSVCVGTATSPGVGWGMDANRVAFATAEHLFRLYVMMFSGMEVKEEAVTSAGAAVESYLVNCGMSHEEAVRLRDEIMLSFPS